MAKDKFVHLLLWMTVASSSCIAAPPTSKRDITPRALFQDPQIYLTISPDAEFRNEDGNIVLLDRMLEMHWENFQIFPSDSIGMFSKNPIEMNATEIAENILESHPITSSSGNAKTSIRYSRRPLTPTMDKCLGFWVAYIRTENENPTILMSECLNIYPTWMNDIKGNIKNIPLSSLMIPGTHNAGAWIHYAGRPSEGVLIEYTYCQEDSIYDQLIHGIRSLDVRVGYYPNLTEKFFINHDVVRVRPLRTLLEDVRKFTLETNEIVFLDFHRFAVGFNSLDIHRELIAFLSEELGDIIAPKSLTLNATPEDLWRLNRTVILLYSNGIVTEYDMLWNGVDQAWGDTNKLDELESFLQESIDENGCKGNAWSLMAQLTSTTMDIVLRPSFGIRGYANMSNNAISQWFQRESWYSKSMIVALDFYRGTNLIETAISVNNNMGNVCL